jgi:hypothetical protein
MVHTMRGRLAVGLFATLAAPAVARAQSVAPQIAVGIAAPSGGLGDGHSIGPVLRGSLLLGAPRRRTHFRMDAEVAWMPGTDGRASAYPSTGDLRVAALMGSFVVASRAETGGAYGLVGGGLQSTSVKGHRNPYGMGAVLQAGAGYRMSVGRIRMHVELTPHMLVSDYATGRDFNVGVYWPALIGVSF